MFQFQDMCRPAEGETTKPVFLCYYTPFSPSAVVKPDFGT